jgi:hypothetical protein
VHHARTAILVAALTALVAAGCATVAPSAADSPSPFVVSPTPSTAAGQSGTTARPSAPPTAASPTAAPSASAAPGLTTVPGTGNAAGDRALAAIRAATTGSRVELTPDVVPWGVELDGTVDDGHGAGRLYVVLAGPGQTGGNLCQDPDFAQGGRCRRVDLGGGSERYERDLVGATNGVRTIVVVVRRPDGSSVLLEAGNFRIHPVPVIVAGQPRPTPEITRDDPILTLAELADLADAIAAATNGCSATACR